MWYPKIDTLENVIKECCSRWSCTEENLVENMFFAVLSSRCEVRINYKDYLLHECNLEYYHCVRARGKSSMMFGCLLSKYPMCVEHSSKTDKRSFTRIYNKLSKLYPNMSRIELERKAITVVSKVEVI